MVVHLEMNGDDKAECSVDLVVSNGFKIEEHLLTEEKLAEYLDEVVPDAVEKIIVENDIEFDNVWDNITLEYSDYKPEGDEMVAYITKINVNHHTGDDKDICLSVLEIDNKNEN
jgi:hypothetical protein